MADYINKIRTTEGDKPVNYEALANKPNSLPNPNKIKFTGSVVAEYDGSSEVTVNIPNGASEEQAAQIQTNTNDISELKNKTSELKGDLTELQNGGYVADQQQIGQKVNAWLDEHPEATTTVQNHSLSIDKMVIGTLGYVTPEMFGAVGDGVTDDTQAIQQALDSGKTVVFNTNTVYIVTERLFLYEKNGVSLIGNNSTLKVAENVKDIQLSSYDFTLLKIYECCNINVMGLNIDGSKDFLYRTDDTNEEYRENTERYLEYRTKGFGGFGVEKCNRCFIQNCSIINTVTGIAIKNSCECVVELCNVSYTSADAYDVWYGSKNVTVRNCRCEQNGDDAFAVYSLLKYWTEPQYGTEEIEVGQCENILFEDCYSLENRARFFINEGGKNVTIDNCIGVNCQWITSITTNSKIHKTQNTIIRNCNVLSKQQSGISNNNILFVYNGNDVKIENCVFAEPEKSNRVISVYGTSNIDILKCKMKNVSFTHPENEESTDYINIEDCYFEKDRDYIEFQNVKNLYLKNSTFIVDWNFPIYVNNISNAIINNINLNTKKIVGSIKNIIIDDVKILHNDLINDALSLVYSSIPYLNTKITSTNVAENSIQFVEGIPYYFKDGIWVNPFESVNALGSDYDCNNLFSAGGRQITYCINGAQNMPINSTCLLVVNGFSNLVNQTLYSSVGVYNRFYDGTSWGSWNKLTANN